MIPFPADCNGCPLREHHGPLGFSLLEGDGSSGLMASAEALGDWEERDGLPLRPWAPSGSIFQRALDERGIARETLTIINQIRCKPPGNELRGTSYERAALDHCRRYFDAAVAERQPRCILALGETPFRELTGYSGITEYRGFMLPAVRYPNTWVVGTYHPAFLLRGAMHLFGVFMRDLQFAATIARNGPPQLPKAAYTLSPTDANVRDFLAYIRADGGRPRSLDLETGAILGWKGDDANRIIQIQFTAQTGQALVLQWHGDGIEAAKEVFATAGETWTWNGRLFDIPLLARNGFTLAGEHHDLLNAWQHINPSFGSGKDDKRGEKGVPARLMSLQSCVSFYIPGAKPWKHVELPPWPKQWWPQPLPMPLKLYGGRDSDYTYRCGVGLFASLRSAGLEAGYREHKYELCKALDAISAHGLPIKRERQLELRAYTEAELARIFADMQAAVPDEIRGIHPKAGYAKPKYELGSFVELKTASGTVVERQFVVGYTSKTQDSRGGDAIWETRQCLLKPFNPSSALQVAAYIKHRGYPMPTRIEDPTKETTGQGELEKLAASTDDAVLGQIISYRKLKKVGLDFTSGAWEPARDGRVHPVFRPNTASGQLTASSPNTQQFPEHSELAKRAKEMIAAEDGYKLVKVDARGFHSRMIGWLANDAAYYKLADFDVHSFCTAHFLHLQGADYLLELPDDELREELGIIKRMHTYVRNYKIKRVIHGAQFGLGVRKLYRMHQQDFESEAEAAQLMAMLKRLFPHTFRDFPTWVRRQIHERRRGRLVSPFHHHRMFFDYDLEQATAWMPSNCAHCELQSAIIRLFKDGRLAKYGCCNMVHDSLWFHAANAQVDECVQSVVAELSLPSTVLVNSPLGPFQCSMDAEVGADLAHMASYA